MRFIIDFTDDASETAIGEYLKAHGCTSTATFDVLGKVYLVEADAEPPVTELVQTVTRDDEHGLKLLDQGVTIRETTDTKTFDTANEDNWWKVAVLPGIDIDAAEFHTYRVAQGVRVYILDSGIDEAHPEFAGKDITLLHSKNDNFTDTTGHGTALASVIVGETCGLTEASVRVVKIFDAAETTYISDLLAGFNAVAEDFANDPLRAAVLNLSWSIPRNQYVEDKISLLLQMGMIVSVAAGNSGIPIENVTPAAMTDVETVGSFGPNLVPSDFSDYTGPTDTSLTAGETNSGPELDLFSPGENIRVANYKGGLGYSAGTSIAAAVYTAVLASEIARLNPDYDRTNYEETLSLLRSSSRIRDLLALSGKFANSPNVTPRTMISTNDVPNYRRYSPHFQMAEKGQPFAAKLFDYTYATSATISGERDGWTIKDNWLVGTASDDLPASGVLRTDITVNVEGAQSDSYVLSIIEWDTSTVDGAGSAAEVADIKFLACCPVSANFCCGICPKDGSACNNNGAFDCIAPGPVNCP